MHIIPAMLSAIRRFVPFVYLTLGVLTACEPLAPIATQPIAPETATRPAESRMRLAPIPAVSWAFARLVDAGARTLAAGVPQPTPTAPATEATAAPTPACDEDSGQVVHGAFGSAIAGTDVTYRAYLPPCFYSNGQRYPYVILLHGTGYDDAMWEMAGVPEVMDNALAKGTLPPMAIFMPNGGYLSELNDQPTGHTYADLIVQEMIPALETDYCLWGSREARAIGGISRGGFWSFSTAFQHPELFSALGGHSPHFEEDNAGPASNPLDLVQTTNFAKNPLRIYLDNAADDYVGRNTRRMSALLRERGVSHEYVISADGGHDMDYWRSHLTSYLAFYGAPWPLDSGQLPSCFEPSPP